MSDTVKDTTFARLCDPTFPDMNARVAERDGTLVGLVHFITHRHCWRVEDVIYLQDLYVSPGARGTGAGRKLIEAVYAAGDAARPPKVYWMTQSHNAIGRRLYDRVGQLTDFIKYERPAA